MIREMARLLKPTGKGWQFAFLLLLRSPVDFAFMLTQAIFLQRAFIAVELGNRSGLHAACLFFGVATLCVFLYNGTIWSVYAPFTTRLEGRLRCLLYDKISAFSCERIEAVSHGEWITRLNADVEAPFSQPLHLPQAANAILRIGLSAWILWHMNPPLLGWILLFVIPHILFNQIFVARAMPGLGKAALEATGKNSGEMSAIVTCAEISALYSAQGYLLKRFEESSRDIFKAKMRIHARKAVSAGIVPLFGLLGYLVLLIVCAGWIAGGRLRFGDLTAAFQYRGGVLAGSLTLINSMTSIQASLAGVRRMNETLYAKTEE